jgi:hypothetical protein
MKGVLRIGIDFVALQEDDRSRNEYLLQPQARINERQARDPNYLWEQSAITATKIPSAQRYIARGLLINNQSKGVACYWARHS